MIKKVKQLYPLCFALFPVLSFYAGNKKELSLEALFLPLLIAAGFYLLVFAISKLLFKDTKKANIFTAVFLLYFFSYGYFKTVPLAVYSLIFIPAVALLLRFKESKRIPIFFSIVGLYLLLSSILNILPYEIQRYNARTKYVASENGMLKPVQQNDAPDIYYLIFDRYANGKILKDQYDFDNSDFLQFLRDRGFYVAEDSSANYPRTHLSLASSLNLEYLDKLVKKVGKDANDYNPVFEMVRDNRVGRFLKLSGYRYFYFGDWWGPTQVNYLADKNINLYANSNEFIRKLVQTTVLSSIAGEYYKGNKLFGVFQDRVYENTNYKFDKLGTIASQKSPKFIFAHMLFPHHPYVFDKDCGKVDPKRRLAEEKKYIAQLQCTNTKIKVMIEAILANSATPPIIIVQSDEGPFKVDEMNLDGEGVDWTKVSDKAIQRHMKILNAYYLPGFDYSQLYQSITPVNSFRLILNHYFGFNLKALPDKSYFIPNIDRPYKYNEITDKILK